MGKKRMKLQSNITKLYKFRELGTDTDFRRLKTIIETGCFWCSSFWDLNDPMEGVYRNSSIDKDRIKEIFDNKNEYKICSFSGEKGLNNLLLWGYYANGFKGVVIEVEVEENETIKPIKYLSENSFILNTVDVIGILTRKLDSWKHEDEFRFLIKSDNNFHKIGKITKVYFGNPYANLNNTEGIFQKSTKLTKYNELKNQLKEICKGKEIDCSDYNSN